MFQKFTEEARKVLKRSKAEMHKLKHPFVGSEHLILSILSEEELEITHKLNELGIRYDNFKKELINTIGIGNSENNYYIYTPLLKRIIENAMVDSKDNGQNEITIESLFISMIDEGEGVAIRIISSMGVNLEELYLELLNKDNSNNKYKNKKKLSIYEFGIDLCKRALEGKIDPVIGREKEINRVIEVLSRRRKNNPLLIGEAGVGKTAIVEALALKIIQKDVPESLLNKKIVSISMANLVAGTKYRGEFEDRISKMIKEIESNPNIIIFIDEIHSLVGAGGAEGAIDASNIFKPALARGKFKLIGATTIKEYKESIEKDKALDRRFQTVLIKEPNLEETKDILLQIKNIYEGYHNVIVNEEIISDIVTLTNKYIFNRRNPDKSIDILDEVCASVSLIKDKNIKKLDILKEEYNTVIKDKNKYIVLNNFEEASKLKEKEIKIESKINNLTLKSSKNIRKIITKEDISRVIKDKVNVPIFEIDTFDTKELRNLEKNLNNNIFGQKEAIKVLCDETKKIKLGFKNQNKPISFLFTGRSGVGKTELVKAYAKEAKMELIRLDMSEFREDHTSSKILGSPPGYVGYSDHNNVLDKIKNNPYSIILLDEIEKASTSVLNLFLQILDEGHITDSTGNIVYFNNTIIIMTSNVGSGNIAIGFGNNTNHVKNKLKDVLSLEFVNRINHIVNFENLDIDTIKMIINKKVGLIKDKFKEYNITLSINDQVIDEIIKLSDYETYGARSIEKILEDKIDNIIINNMLEGNRNIKINNI